MYNAVKCSMPVVDCAEPTSACEKISTDCEGDVCDDSTECVVPIYPVMKPISYGALWTGDSASQLIGPHEVPTPPSVWTPIFSVVCVGFLSCCIAITIYLLVYFRF